MVHKSQIKGVVWKAPICYNDVIMNESIRQRIDVLIPLLKDPDPEVRTMAAHAIEHLEASSDIQETLQALKTGNMGARHKLYAESLGVSEYLNKPVKMDRLITSAEKLLAPPPAA